MKCPKSLEKLAAHLPPSLLRARKLFGVGGDTSEEEKDKGLCEGRAVENGGEESARERQVRSRYGDIKL